MEEQPVCCKSLYPRVRASSNLDVQPRPGILQPEMPEAKTTAPSLQSTFLQVHPVVNRGHRPRTALMASPGYLVTLYKVVTG